MHDVNKNYIVTRKKILHTGNAAWECSLGMKPGKLGMKLLLIIMSCAYYYFFLPLLFLLQEMKDVQEWLDKCLPPAGGNM